MTITKNKTNNKFVDEKQKELKFFEQIENLRQQQKDRCSFFDLLSINIFDFLLLRLLDFFLSSSFFACLKRLLKIELYEIDEFESKI